jgi:hypothetical protein
MRKTIYFSVIFSIFLGCGYQTPKKNLGIMSSDKPSNKSIKLHKLDKLYVVGEFYGDEKEDTIFQHNFSKLSKSEIEYSPDPTQTEYDEIVKWFNYQDTNLYLTINNTKLDTLYLEAAIGLYCLINIGDNNKDGKDEIAFVVNYPDYSSVNSCKIYSLCKSKWTHLKQFGVHESSFEYKSAQAPIFKNIKHHLEYENNKWVFRDNLNDKEEANKMEPLYLAKCK